ncbi:nitrilase-related carbon-nitrogen hydrolase [Fervidibacter sacchari]|uniref:Apolipoprotein N-acyltransferase n=1 Tax=Candidatus Fervidibacter sacchari TaxID=1448929 RepID=A0ABT2ELK7_9BACT|nr:nitrilase-related carbon-nitrogen hydrolase [Candidatus Fervidibacter sacchari]MCS3918826.1 apolipoprotein N-acyltransferase [Candidatus Fervidibacter sacchari]WKU17428.1 nitrilase-related carbon-nitrogen hydrolase [Candidatus Fervidibacter sacchari]
MKALLLSVVGGLIFGASVPPCRLSVMAYLGLALLLIANSEQIRWGQRALCSILWGLAASVFPIAFSIRIAKIQGATYPVDFGTCLVTLAPFFLLSLVVGIVASISGKLWQTGFWRGFVWILGVSALGVIAERLTFFLPIPVQLAITQTPMRLTVLSLVSFFGVWFASWFVWFFAALIAEVLMSKRVDLAVLGSGIVLAIAILAPVLSPKFEKAVKVALVQPCFDDPLRMAKTVKNAEIIVLPELALGQETDLMRKALSETAAKTGALIVAGLAETDPPYNAAVLVSPEGKELLRHRKIHLFGAERWRFRKGNEVKAHGEIGIAICFDTVFPDVVRELARQGAKIIAVPNTDPPSIGYLLHHLHAAFLPIRAIENDVAILKADLTGLSQVIEPDGRVVAEAPLDKPVVLEEKLRVVRSTTTTPFTRFGDWFVYFCAIMAAVLLILEFAGRVKRDESRPISKERAAVCDSQGFGQMVAEGDDKPVGNGGAQGS